MKKSCLPFLILFLFQIFSSCKSDDTLTDPGNGDGTTYIPNASGQPIPDFSSTTNFNGYMCAINYDFGISGQSSFSVTMGFAQFNTGIDAGTVKVNNNELNKTTQSGKTYYLSPSANNPTGWLINIPFDGSNHNWTVTGGNGIPSINGNVSSPAAFTISSPVSNGTVSRSGNIQVNWSNPSSARVMLVLMSSEGSKYYMSQDQVDNGNHTIPSSALSSFPSGNAALYLIKYKYSSVSGSDGKTYILIAEIFKMISVVLN
jgi:hypothetical protein